LRKFKYNRLPIRIFVRSPGLAGGAGSGILRRGAGGFGGGGSLLVAAVALCWWRRWRLQRRWARATAGFGGGGGSFDAGLNPILGADFQAGNGEVLIIELAPPAPELSSLAMIGTGPAGLTGLTAMLRRSKA
jgi:hypothetical protein